MKKLLKVSLLLTLFAFCFSFAGCQKEGYGDFSLSLKDVGADFVDVMVTAPSKVEMHYLLSDEPQLVTDAVLQKKGTTLQVQPGQIVRIDKGVVQNTHYYLYAVAALDGGEYSDRVVLEFTTKNYTFNETVKIVETYYDGFKVHVTVPEKVKAAGNVLRYGYTSLAAYNKASKLYGTTDVLRLIHNGNIGARYIKNDSTLVYDPTNIYEMYEGEELDYHDDIFPNEPGVFLVGEFRWGSSKEEIEAAIGFSGWYPSYIIPLYDWKSALWTGEFQRVDFKTKAPEVLEADFDVEVYDISPLNASVSFYPGEEVYQYMYMIMDDAIYNTLVDLCGGEENIQWFLSSTIGFMEGSQLGRGDVNILCFGGGDSSPFLEPLNKDTRYRILVNAWGDSKGTSQKFFVKEFRTLPATQPKPVIEVTAVDDDDPYLATFNIKAGKDKNGNVQPIAAAYYAVNYAREWQLKFNTGSTYESILKGNYSFSSDDLAQINSPEGLNFSVYTLDGEVTRMAVYGCNEEYTFNIVDPSDQDLANGIARGWADYVAPYAKGKGPASSYASVADQLSGVWTASAKLKAKQLVDEDSEEYEYYEVIHKSKVELSSKMPELPTPMPDSIYTIYGGDPAEVDGMYEELQMLSDMFEECRLKSYSRILASGFLDFDYYSTGGRLDWYSPFDLFVNKNYISVDVAQLIYDFGPKWFIQVQDDGSLIVPFSQYYLPPMHNWPGYSYYLGGVGTQDGKSVAVYEATDKYPGFPVQVSEDGETIVIKPINYEGTELYMNALGFTLESMASGNADIVAPVISEITLTRGWDDSNAKRNRVIPEKVTASVMSLDGTPCKAPIVRKVGSMTSFDNIREATVVTNATVVTEEMLDAYMLKQVEKYFGKINLNE
ncbi:MAG: hypothetical protein IKZ08_00520 [Bacteroidales bacterium]|nr:hypothetical protein [Bacteroidales bacterium]MBR5861804.1 hypothetical protein [Bacteroidales bacterium]